VVFPEYTGDFWLLQTDKDGGIEWNKRIGGFRQDRLWSIIQTNDGGYLIGGESRSGIGMDRTTPNRGENDYWIVKLDATGNKQWDRAYGGTGADELRKIIALPNGQFCLTGFSNSPAGFEKSTSSINNSEDYWVVRIDENGTPLNDFSIGSDSLDWLYDATLTTDGNLILVGQSKSEAGFGKTAPLYGQNDMWLVKCSPTGTIFWDATFGGNGIDVCQRIRKSRDGNYFVAGESSSDKMSGNKTANHFGGTDLWVVKFSDSNSGPSIIWDKAYGGVSNDFGYDVAETELGTLLLFGQSTSPPLANGKDAALIGGNDYWCIFANPLGNKLWEETLGGATEDIGRFSFLAHDYGYILAGASRSNISPPYKSQDNRGPSYTDDLWIVRTGCAFPPPILEDLPKVCKDDIISLDATVNGPCDGCTYVWQDGTAGPLRSLQPDSTTEYKVTVVHPDGCEKSDSLVIEIVPGPDNFTALSEPVSCYGKKDASFSIDGITGGAPPYQFSFNGGEWNETDSYFNLGAGLYELEILDTNGCKLDTSFIISQPDSVIVNLGPDVYLELGDSLQIQALTNLVDSFSFYWGQPLQLSCGDCLEPWVKPFLTTTYSIEVKDKNGCKATDNLLVIVQKEDNVYIPTAFSPNNLDNINDFFTVYAGKSVEKIRTLQVYDRWGELMFENYNFQPNKPTIGWDGKHHGRPLDPAVFTYWTEVEYVDGRVETFYGSLTLMN
ncbi:MAG: gliding motility-associated C-terminal domain-containing protein, partial [Saprospiraceae bacterium]|nr:gliding motility-associated C-terminal domain-containing protein [Saprospiraceae bacterium]